MRLLFRALLLGTMIGFGVGLWRMPLYDRGLLVLLPLSAFVVVLLEEHNRRPAGVPFERCQDCGRLCPMLDRKPSDVLKN